ncbi:gag-pol polyprotein [Tanacetum coccineum]
MRQKDLRTYKIDVVMNRPMKNMLKNLKTSGRLALWAVELNTYHIIYVLREEAEGQRLYTKREASKEGSKVGLMLIDPEGKEYSHAIRLNFHASEDDMDYEALLAGLAVVVRRQMKDLHMFVTLKLLVDQVKGNKEPKKGRAREKERNIRLDAQCFTTLHPSI